MLILQQQSFLYFLHRLKKKKIILPFQHQKLFSKRDFFSFLPVLHETLRYLTEGRTAKTIADLSTPDYTGSSRTAKPAAGYYQTRRKFCPRNNEKHRPWCKSYK